MRSQLSPPGATQTVHAQSVLVLAPHYDDEVLGCGGLAAQLAAAGAVVRVLFLSDSGGGIEEIDEPQAYRERRLAEAGEAVAILDLDGFETLDLPDGGLKDHPKALAAGIGRAVEAQKPDLVLVTSPLETSPDHRAAFQALHRYLQEDGGRVVQGDLRIFAYEGNQPFYPDLLVDVTAQAPLVEKAMAVYRSQEERHPYLRARRGLWQLRTLTLTAEAAAETEYAEAYRQLTANDFVTRSPAQLITHLGGAPELLEVNEGPRLSVVVRTRDRPELLGEALASLAASTYHRAEVVVVNDGGQAPELPEEFPLDLKRVDLEQNQGRAAALNAGIAAANGDAVCFLDDDDVVAPEHLATLAGLLTAAGVRVAYSDAAVTVHELAEDGWRETERRLPYSRDFDGDLLLFDNYIPFNTVVIDRDLLHEIGGVDESLPFFEDWDLLIRLAEKTAFHHLARVTCEYRHFRKAGHHVLADDPRQRADFLDVKAKVLEKHAGRRTAAVTARVVDALRAEAVQEKEEVRRERGEREKAEERAFALNGEVEALRLSVRASEELQRRTADEMASAREEQLRLYQREKELIAEIEKQGVDNQHWIAEWQGRAESLERQVEEVRAAAEADVEAAHTAHGDTTEKLRLMTEQEGRVAAELRGTYDEIQRLNSLIETMEETRAWRLHQWVQARRGR